ncbi:hypothetical protein PHJA_001326100 [Phtheirospermum japonicum]|uniref:S-protein homolog n=1 Tax=Phtheirospermum japonicum TaxID=374723 RepID=A0A830CC81_9LAMI|nr:hypothetical protein PHJA_001326100 [Phtheirospermum japonicum]
MKITFLSFIVLFNIFNVSARKCIFTRKVAVYVNNRLDPKSPSLKIHCASKNDDLGNHIIYAGREYSWTFCENFLPTTLFFCHLWWGSKQKAFEAFKETWFELKPLNFYWYAYPDGIYFTTYNASNYFPTTLFFCHLWWGSKQTAFEAFREYVFEFKDPHCYWFVKPDGIYFSRHNNSGTMDKRFDWS